METVLCNGRPAATVAVTDRGLHYGDGVFRTLLVVAGQALAWDTHYQRLHHDCRRLQLPPPAPETLLDEQRRLFADGGSGVLKIMVTRGSGGRGYTPPSSPEPRRLLLRYPSPDYTRQGESGVALDVCETRLGCNPALAGVKHLNRLEQVMARAECARAGRDEGLVLDGEGRVISGTMSNLFIVENGGLTTPVLDRTGVLGATRQRIFAAAAAAGRACRERELNLDDCLAADELFLCNSLIGVWPVRRLGEQAFAPGPVSRWCQQQLQRP